MRELCPVLMDIALTINPPSETKLVKGKIACYLFINHQFPQLTHKSNRVVNSQISTIQYACVYVETEESCQHLKILFLITTFGNAMQTTDLLLVQNCILMGTSVMTFFTLSLLKKILQGSGDLPDPDKVIRVTRVQSVAIGGECKRQALWILNLAGLGEGRLEDIHQALVLKVPNLDGGTGGSAKPVAVRREGESMNNIVGFERVQMTAFVKIPQHDNSVLASRGAEGAIGRDGNSVDVSIVADKVASQLQLCKIPYLNVAVDQLNRYSRRLQT